VAGELDLLLALIDQGFDRASWHGPNLRGSIRGLTAQQASRRPARGRHNIWEQVVHAAYWKYVVWRRLTGEKRGSFGIAGSNWIARSADGLSPAAAQKLWKSDIALLERTHLLLRQAVAGLSPAALHKLLPGSRDRRLTPARLISAIAMHDVYHAGQIGLLKRLVRSGA